jgi:hypothetical protein
MRVQIKCDCDLFMTHTKLQLLALRNHQVTVSKNWFCLDQVHPELTWPSPQPRSLSWQTQGRPLGPLFSYLIIVSLVFSRHNFYPADSLIRVIFTFFMTHTKIHLLTLRNQPFTVSQSCSFWIKSTLNFPGRLHSHAPSIDKPRGDRWGLFFHTWSSFCSLILSIIITRRIPRSEFFLKKEGEGQLKNRQRRVRSWDTPFFAFFVRACVVLF